MQSTKTAIPPPPDGGYGYVCIIAAFLLQCLFGLVVRSFGIIYLLLLDRYETTASLAAWVGATNLLLYGLGGPLSSMLCKWFNHRSVAIAGCLLEAIGFIITGYSPNIATVYLGFGIFVGLGVAMSTVSSFLILDKYFLKKKSMATCIAASGVGVSMFVLPPLMNYFDQEYGFQGTMLILAGICLNGIVCAALFRPLEFPVNSSKVETDSQNHSTPLFVHAAQNSSAENIVLTSMKKINEDVKTVSELDSSNVSEKENTREKENGMPNSKVRGKSDESISDESCNVSNTEKSKICNGTEDTNLKANPDAKLEDNNIMKNDNSEMKHTNDETKTKTENNSAELDVEISSDIDGNSVDTANPSKLRSCMALIQDVPAVVGLMMLSLFFTISDSCVYAFVPALAIDQGIAAESAKLLIAWGGISDMIHRIAYGFIMDYHRIRPYRVHLYCIVALISSITTLTFPLYSKHTAYIIAIVVFGGFTGVVFAQRVTITSDLTGPERTPLAFGFVIALNACGHVTGRMIGGIIKDSLGTYDLVFFISGSLPAMAAITFLVLVIFCVKEKRNE